MKKSTKLCKNQAKYSLGTGLFMFLFVSFFTAPFSHATFCDRSALFKLQKFSNFFVRAHEMKRRLTSLSNGCTVEVLMNFCYCLKFAFMVRLEQSCYKNHGNAILKKGNLKWLWNSWKLSLCNAIHIVLLYFHGIEPKYWWSVSPSEYANGYNFCWIILLVLL